jgi:multiple sugar transport system permease protein
MTTIESPLGPLRKPRWRWAPYGFVAPFAVLFGLFYALPIGYAVWSSLQKTVRTGGGEFGGGTAHQVFGGLVNYKDVLNDGAFSAGLLRVFLFGVVQVPVMLGVALLLALILDSGLARFVRFFRLTYFLPYAVPGVIGAILWGFLYTPGLSPIDQLLGTNVNLLSNGLILFAIGNIVTWSWTGYNMLILFASLQAIPQDIFEAARLDRASNLQIALRIKIPMLRPALLLTCVFSIIGTLQLFTEPAVLQQITGTVTSTFTPNLMAYSEAFNSNNPAFAAAISVSLALITFVLSFGFLRLVWRRATV